jgi:hypothetical protein
MNTMGMLTGVALLFVLIGMILSTLLRQKSDAKTKQSDSPDSESDLNLAQPLWDAHTVFNVMNRMAIASERGGGIAASSIYSLSDHLLQGVLLQRDFGWANQLTIEAWLKAYLGLITESHEQSGQASVQVDLAPGVHRFDAGPIIRQLIWRLQSAQMVEAVNVTFNVVDSSMQLAVAKLEVIGDLDLFGRIGRDCQASPWRVETRASHCSIEVSYKPLI